MVLLDSFPSGSLPIITLQNSHMNYFKYLCLQVIYLLNKLEKKIKISKVPHSIASYFVFMSKKESCGFLIS